MRPKTPLRSRGRHTETAAPLEDTGAVSRRRLILAAAVEAVTTAAAVGVAGDLSDRLRLLDTLEIAMVVEE